MIMPGIEISKQVIEERPGRSGAARREEIAILRANRRYFKGGSGAPAKKDDCETAILGAINRYFRVDVVE